MWGEEAGAAGASGCGVAWGAVGVQGEAGRVCPGPPLDAAKGPLAHTCAPSVSVPRLKRWPRVPGTPTCRVGQSRSRDRLSIPVITTVEAEDRVLPALELGLRAQDEAWICTVASRGQRLECGSRGAPVGGFRDLGSRSQGPSASAPALFPMLWVLSLLPLLGYQHPMAPISPLATRRRARWKVPSPQPSGKPLVKGPR